MSKVGVIAGLSALALAGAGLVWANRSIEPMAAGTVADRVVVEKAARRLSIYSHGALIRSYAVSLGRSPVGSKEREGDRRTPEGEYLFDRHNPNSAFHLALHVSYPSVADGVRARAAGDSPGGDTMIHGMRKGLGWVGRAYQMVDWTSGCIAVTDAEMDQLYRAIPDGTAIEIKP